MNQDPISPEDPRLTLYALDEMEPAERAGFEQLLQTDPAARQIVQEIQATAATLTAALEHEPAEATDKPAAKLGAKVLRFPQLYFMVSGLAAACFALFFAYWQQSQPVYQEKKYVEVNLVKGKSADEKGAGGSVTVGMALPPAESTKEQPAVTMDLAGRDEMKDKAEQDVGDTKVRQAASLAGNSERRPQAIVNLPASAPASRRDDEPLKLDAFVVTGTAAGSVASAATLAGGRVPAVSVEGVLHQAKAGSPYLATLKKSESNTATYAYHKDNGFLRVVDEPRSTFSADVDTASYANVRRFITQGRLPPADAVRIEELVNYFPYHYQPPTGEVPFAASLEVASAPWAPEHRLVRIGLKGRELSETTGPTGSPQARPATNLVFLLDVSGSMNEPNRLPLVKKSLRLLVNTLRPDDQVGIVVYAGASGLALPSTRAAHKAEILEAIDSLQAEGSTNGAMGIQLAYDIAKANFVTGGVNRVILATDGDFNVGVTSEGELVRLVQEKAKSGVFLTVLGFGTDNLKDATLEQLADKANGGNYAYIDSLAEAKKVLVEQAGGTLVTIAKDVKLQVEFNPAQVQAYRLIGYENRLLAQEDFNNDKVDAGEIGAGHTVTALYEVVPAGAPLPGDTPAVDALKYQKTKSEAQSSEPGAQGQELLTVKIRYKEPTGDVSRLLEFPLRDAGARFEDASQDFKFAAAVAAFGMALRDSSDKGALTLSDVAAWGRAGLGNDTGGYRTEFISLVEQAQQLAQ